MPENSLVVRISAEVTAEATHPQRELTPDERAHLGLPPAPTAELGQLTQEQESGP